MTTDAHPRIRAGVFLIALCAIGLRLWLALAEAPGGGDPSYSYAYRAVLLLDGQWDALWLMWHPPGMPIAMALVSLASGGWLAPWWAGVAVTLACTAGLIVVIDNLLRHRIAAPALRLAAALLIATQESLVHWARMPLTEPVFLLLLMVAVLIVDREDPRPAALMQAGVLVGLSSLFRFEGLVALAGLAAGVWWTTRRATAALTVLSGGAIGAAWMLANPAYVVACVVAQGTAYTVPRVSIDHGVLAVAARVPKVLHHALTTWLPNVLLLPFWMMASVGIWVQREPAGRRLTRLLMGVLAPVALAVMWSVMHKRTGAFLVPAVVVWVVLALDAWVNQSGRPARRLAAAGLVVLALCGMDAARLVHAMRSVGSEPGFVQVEVDILRARAAAPGAVFAFGVEPSLYGLLGWPEPYAYWARRETYGARYRSGEPAALIRALRAAGTRYLAFYVPASGTSQPQAWAGPDVVPEDLRALVQTPAAYGLVPVGSGQSAEGAVVVFEVAR